MPASTAQTRHRFLLDLKAQQGSLGTHWLDLPAAQPPAQGMYYLRRRERGRLPASYRSGLVFGAVVMMLSILSLTGINAKTMAESQQSWLSAELIQEFSQLQRSLGDSAASADNQQEHFSILNTQHILRQPQPISGLLQGFDQTENLETIGLTISSGYQSFQSFLEDWSREDSVTVLDRLAEMRRAADLTLVDWNKALQSAQNYPLARLSAAELQPFQATLATLTQLTDFLNAFTRGYEPLVTMLGSKSPQRLLVFFQDAAEKKAGGGTLSAGVEVLVEDGHIITWKPFLSSDYDDSTALTNANATLDVPKAADQIQSFWQREAHSSVDATIFIDTSVLEQLFDTESLQAKGLDQFAQRWSDLRLNGKGDELKKLASSALETLLDGLRTPNLLVNNWIAVRALAAAKELMVVSSDVELEQQLTGLGVTGALPSPGPQEDILMVATVNTETSASDRTVEEQDRLDTAIDDDGSIHHWLKIQRRNSSDGSVNASLIRVVVPRGSRLSSVDGVNMTDVSTLDTENTSVWSFPTRLAAGQSREIALLYDLPWRFDTSSIDNYRLTLVHQPGKAVGFEHHIKLPASLIIFQQLPETPISSLDSDKTIAVVAGRKP